MNSALKTFRRYLLSYVCTLLVPITILSVIIMNIITDYCGAQVTANNVGALSQLEAAVSMQISQMDAYTLQTSQRSEFFARTLAKTGSFYNVQRVLSNWSMASSFFETAYYHNTALDEVYGFNGVYTQAYFGKRMAQEMETETDPMQELLQSPEKKMWLRSRRPGSKLYYASFARMSPAQKGMMLFEINLEALHGLIRASSLYRECETYLYTTDGMLLYADSADGSLPPRELLQQLTDASGVIELEGEKMLYARQLSENDGLMFVNIVPQRIANEPLRKLTMTFVAGLLLIFALGGTVITLVMRANYMPIRRLEHDALSAQVLSEHTDDAVINVRNALQAMQSRNLLIVGQTEALSKERLILRLLLGGYPSAEAFNADGAEQGLSLPGDRWHIALLRGEGAGCEEEDFAPRLIEQAQGLLPGPLLYLEVPEHHSVVFIVQGEAACTPAELEEALKAGNLSVRALLSHACSHTEQLAAAYVGLMHASGAGREHQRESEYPHELYDALKNALEFGEAERIDFTLGMLKSAIPDMTLASGIHALLYDVLHLVQAWLESRNDAEAVEAVRRLAHMQMEAAANGAEVRIRSERLLSQLGALISEQLASKPGQPNTLLNEMEAYLQANFRDENFTVQRVADHFRLSISNLSHYFKNHIGVSVSEYVERLRIQSARELLLQTDISVADVAHEVGYAQPATFMRAFKKVCGLSPTAFRSEAAEQ